MMPLFLISSVLFFLFTGWRMMIINTARQSSLLSNTAPDAEQNSSASFLFLLSSGIVVVLILFIISLSQIILAVLPAVHIIFGWLIVLLLTALITGFLLFLSFNIFRNTHSKQTFYLRKKKNNEENPHLTIDNNEALENLAVEDENENDPIELFENALGLFNIEISECLIPRKEIVGVELTDSFEDIKQTFIDSKHSKLIVYENDMDNILGYVHHSDFYGEKATIKELISEIPTVPQTMSALEMLSFFKRKQKSIAWVVDEFGGTEGILTTEDLLEELFGEIEDEHDHNEYIEQQIASNEFIFSGRLEVEYINDKFDLEIPTEYAETLSGYIIEEHNEIPQKDEKIVIDNYEYKILQVTKTRIETIKLKVLEE